jgi:hypothetical protein
MMAWKHQRKQRRENDRKARREAKRIRKAERDQRPGEAIRGQPRMRPAGGVANNTRNESELAPCRS